MQIHKIKLSSLISIIFLILISVLSIISSSIVYFSVEQYTINKINEKYSSLSNISKLYFEDILKSYESNLKLSLINNYHNINIDNIISIINKEHDKFLNSSDIICINKCKLDIPENILTKGMHIVNNRLYYNITIDIENIKFIFLINIKESDTFFIFIKQLVFANYLKIIYHDGNDTIVLEDNHYKNTHYSRIEKLNLKENFQILEFDLYPKLKIGIPYIPENEKQLLNKLLYSLIFLNLIMIFFLKFFNKKISEFIAKDINLLINSLSYNGLLINYKSKITEIQFLIDKFNNVLIELENKNKEIYTIYENIPNAIIKTDSNNKIISFNNTFKKYLDIPENEIYNYSLTELKDFIKTNKFIDTISYTKHIVDNNTILINKTKIPNSDYFLNVVTNITEIVNLKKELKFIKCVIDSIPNPIFIKDIDGKYYSCNKSFEIFSKTNFDDIIGKTTYEIWKTENGLTVHNKDMTLITNRINESYEEGITFDNKHIIYFVKRLIYNDNGELFGLVGSITDITEIINSKNEIEELKNRYDLAIQASSDGIWDYDLKNNNIYYSNSWRHILGFSENDNIIWDNIIHPDDLEDVRNERFNYLNKIIPSYNKTYRIMHKNGQYRYILSKGIALWNNENIPYRFIGTITDVTYEKDLMNEMALSIEDINRTMLEILNSIQIGIIIYDISHKIIYTNNFINSIFDNIIGLNIECFINIEKINNSFKIKNNTYSGKIVNINYFNNDTHFLLSIADITKYSEAIILSTKTLESYR